VCPDSQSVQELRETCDYFMIPFSEKTVKTNNLSMLLSVCMCIIWVLSVCMSVHPHLLKC